MRLGNMIVFTSRFPWTLLRMAPAIGMATAILAGCNGGTAQLNPPGLTEQSAAHRRVGRPTTDPNLYVVNNGNATVTGYAPGSGSVLRTISQGINGPFQLAFDAHGNLYVANGSANTVTVYAPGKIKLKRTISQGVGEPAALAFDGAGDLYVANYDNGTVTVYAPATTSPY
jgi:hypothetical protein